MPGLQYLDTYFFSLIECLFRHEWLDNAKDFCYNLPLPTTTDDSDQKSDEDEAFFDDIRGAHHRLRAIHSDHGSSSDFGSSDDD